MIISTPPPSADVFEEPDEPVETEWRSLLVGTQAHGMRLDRALADAVSEFSRNYLQQLIEAGAVELDARACKHSAPRASVHLPHRSPPVV